MTSKASARDPYLVKSVVHSSRVLSAFRASGEALPLREIAARGGLPKSMVFRLLYTLERCGMLEKVGENLYRSSLRPFKQRLYRIGYAAQGTDYQFSKEVSAGLERAAAAEGVELISVDNRYNPKSAQRNAGMLVGMKDVCPHLEQRPVTCLDGDGVLGDSFEAMRRHLRTSRSRRILVGAINDPSALGALRAFQEAGRTDASAIVGHNASPEG